MLLDPYQYLGLVLPRQDLGKAIKYELIPEADSWGAGGYGLLQAKVNSSHVRVHHLPEVSYWP